MWNKSGKYDGQKEKKMRVKERNLTKMDIMTVKEGRKIWKKGETNNRKIPKRGNRPNLGRATVISNQGYTL